MQGKRGEGQLCHAVARTGCLGQQCVGSVRFRGAATSLQQQQSQHRMTFGVSLFCGQGGKPPCLDVVFAHAVTNRRRTSKARQGDGVALSGGSAVERDGFGAGLRYLEDFRRVGLQIVRDWVLRFSAHGPEGLIDRKAPGQAPKLNAIQRQALAEKVECGPPPAVDGVVRWRLKDLAQWIVEEFGISLDKMTVGQKNKITRRCARRARRTHDGSGRMAHRRPTGPG